MTMSKELGKLEEEALKRKERLKNLKRKFDGLDKNENGNEAIEGEKEKTLEIPK